MMKSNWKEYIIELLIVIIGITIAFSLNNLAESNKEQRLEAKYLMDIRSDLARDSANLVHAIRFNEKKVARLEGVIGLISTDRSHEYMDSLMTEIGVIGNYIFFHSESFTMSSLLQSGDFKLLSSDPLKKELLRLKWMSDRIETDQTNFLHALDDNYYPKLLAVRDMITNEVLDEDFFYGIEFKNWTAYVYNDTKNMTGFYKRILTQVNEAINLIDTQLEE